MAERKVLNKYIPPDFDPDKLMESKKLLKKIEKRKNKNKNKKKLLNIRMMYPFTLKCNKCKNFTYVGTKFNSRVEKLKDETYLDIPIWKFYGKCQECKNEIIFKTDPKNGDYLLISGGTRTYDAHKEQELADDFYRTNNNVQEEDKIKNTEKESYNALLELKRNEQLEELQNMNKRHIDKFNSINKALSHLYEKNEKNNENNFYMNYLDPKDEEAFFNLLNRSRTCTDEFKSGLNKNLGTISTAYIGESSNVIIEEEEIKEIEEGTNKEELKDDIINKNEEKVDTSKETEKNIRLMKTNNHNNLDETKKLNEDNKIDSKSTITLSKNDYALTKSLNNISDLKSKQIFKKRNLETEYNFIIKKKEDLSSIFNEYNSDNTDDSKN